MADTQRDPVCGMKINTQDAASSSQHEGRTYYFCSTNCRLRFDQNPQQYVKVQGQTTGKSA